jgi:hypothetical protein
VVTINGSVGRGGRNARGDVIAVQLLLNANLRLLIPLRPLALSGLADPPTIGAIEEFQRRVLRNEMPNGLVTPGGWTLRKLQSVPPAAGLDAATKLSGQHWCLKFPTSVAIDDLAKPFREHVAAFVKMLRDNKAIVDIRATRRPRERAYLMHWSWKIAKGKVAAVHAPRRDPYGIGIVWDHGEAARSRAAAQEMADGFGIGHLKYAPALGSHHIAGHAIDMLITQLPAEIAFTRQGREVKVTLGAPPDGSFNAKLHSVAERYFKVKKLVSDVPHWSIDGK